MEGEPSKPVGGLRIPRTRPPKRPHEDDLPSVDASSIFGGVVSTSAKPHVSFDQLVGGSALDFDDDGEQEVSQKHKGRPTEFDFERAKREREAAEKLKAEKAAASAAQSTPKDEEAPKGETAEQAPEVPPPPMDKPAPPANDEGEETPAAAASKPNEDEEKPGDKPTVPDAAENAAAAADTTPAAAPTDNETDKEKSTANSGGGGLFGFSQSSTVFGHLPTLKPLSTTEAAEPAPTMGGDFEEVKSTRPTSFPGEDQETVLFEDYDASLAVVVKVDDAWTVKQHGPGCVRVLKDDAGSIRCVFRTKGVWKLELNAPKNTFSIIEQGNARAVKFMAFDIKKTEDDPAMRRSVFNLVFPTAEKAKAFLSLIAP